MAFFLLQTIGGLGALSYLDLESVAKAALSIKKKDDGTNSDRDNSSSTSSPSLIWSSPTDESVSTASKASALVNSVAQLAYLGSVGYSIYTLYRLCSRDHSYSGGGLLSSRRRQRIEEWKWPSNGFRGSNGFVNNDGLLLHCREWRPTNAMMSSLTSSGTVILMHGLGTHSGLYEDAARALADRGFIVRGFDMQGHGRSEGDRFYLRRWRDLVEDGCGFVQALKSSTVSKPGSGEDIFLVGMSEGALVALLVAEKLQKDIKGVILVGPKLTGPQNSNDNSPLDKIYAGLESVLGELFPHLPLWSTSLGNLVGSAQQNSLLENDPLCDGVIPARTAVEYRENAPTAFDTAKTVALPLLLLMAEQNDHLKASEAYLKEYAFGDKAMHKLKSKGSDLLLDEVTRGDSVELIARWAEGKTASGATKQWAASVTSHVTSAFRQGISKTLK